MSYDERHGSTSYARESCQSAAGKNLRSFAATGRGAAHAQVTRLALELAPVAFRQIRHDEDIEKEGLGNATGCVARTLERARVNRIDAAPAQLSDGRARLPPARLVQLGILLSRNEAEPVGLSLAMAQEIERRVKQRATGLDHFLSVAELQRDCPGENDLRRGGSSGGE